jgi:hypothetical protein
MKINVKHCARCEQDHADLEFAAFTEHPVPVTDKIEWTHWAMCPALNEPVLMRVILVEEAPLKDRPYD